MSDPKEFPQEAVDTIVSHNEKRKQALFQTIVLMIVLAVSLTALAIVISQNDDFKTAEARSVARANESDRKVDANAKKIEAQNRTIEAQRKQFNECKGTKGNNNPRCKTPIAPPNPVKPELPTQPVKQVTEDEVRVIANAEISRRGLVVSPSQLSSVAKQAASLVPKPKDGISPTPEQVKNVVVATVAAVCANDACKGDTGKTGEQGPGPTDEQVAAIVKTFCNSDGRVDCVGAKGNTGDTGPKGSEISNITTAKNGDDLLVTFLFVNSDGNNKDFAVTIPAGPKGDTGRGIDKITCPDDDDPATSDQFHIVYTDGTFTDVGVCRQGVISEPPTPEPTASNPTTKKTR